MTNPQKNELILETWTNLKEKILSKFSRSKSDLRQILFSLFSKTGYELSEEFKEHFKVKTVDDEIVLMIEVIGKELDYLNKIEPGGPEIEEVD